MSQQTRDRLVGLAAVIVVMAVGIAIVMTLSDAERRGRRALENLEQEQLNQLANAMTTRVDEAYETLGGIVNAPPEWALVPAHPVDQARLDALAKLNPSARVGAMVIDAQRRITAGVLLQSVAIGEVLDRPGLTDVFATGEPAFLPVHRGSTTDLPTMMVVLPIKSAAGAVRGAFTYEAEVTEDSAFNAEVKTLARGKTGEFMFVDSRGTVLAASTPGRLGQAIDDRSLLSAPDGIVRRDGRIIATATLERVGWKAIFRQDAREFEQGLSERLGRAVSLLVVAALLGGGIAFVALLRRLQAAREEQQRLTKINKATEEFVSIVSHELRTPVAGVLGFLETTIDHWDAMTDVERLDAVGRAAANARRLQGLTRDVLDTAAIDTGDFAYTPEAVDLGALLRASGEWARGIAPERTVVVHTPVETVWVWADSQRIEQVMMNLLDNAMKNSPVDAEVEVRLTVHDGEAAVAVIDRGPGLHASELDRVFEKFVRGRSPVRGTGLGLYICRRIIEAHGGRIWASSLEGTWATFSFTLPLAAAPPSTPERAAAPATSS